MIQALRLVTHLFVFYSAFKLLDFWLNVSELVFSELKLCFGLKTCLSDRVHVLFEGSGQVVYFLLAVFLDLCHGLFIVKHHTINLIPSELN